MLDNLSAITEAINTQSRFVSQIKEEMEKVLVGQEKLINGLLIGLLANGHILLEGVPGLAKTLAVKILASTIKADFQRIQFTPDLLPADLLGTLIYNPQTGDFITKKGPIFAQIILADEINRAPAKVQSALLGDGGKQVTIGENIPLVNLLWFGRKIPWNNRALILTRSATGQIYTKIETWLSQ